MYIHLLNDDINTVEYVVKCLMSVCGHNYYQAEQCALITHNTGKCTVDSGFDQEMVYVYLQLAKSGLNVQLSQIK
tara:strand:+ start:846 stop:1070 length:225 start_codon:yes stop_codon:yes gene_type:complete